MFHVFCTITKINFNSITMVPLESGCQRVLFCFVLMVVKNKDSLKSCRLGSEFYYCVFIYLFLLGMHQNQVFLFVSESSHDQFPPRYPAASWTWWRFIPEFCLIYSRAHFIKSWPWIVMINLYCNSWKFGLWLAVLHFFNKTPIGFEWCDKPEL